MRALYPVRCPLCRGRLTSWRLFPAWVRRCRKCDLTVSYSEGGGMVCL